MDLQTSPIETNYSLDRRIIYLLFAFFFLYLASLAGFFQPIFEDIVFLLPMSIMVFLAFWRFNYAILFFLGEFLFLQAGHFFELGGISLRLVFLIFLIGFWFFKTVIRKEPIIFFQSPVMPFLVVFSFFILFSILRGYFSNDKILVIRDGIAYSFFLLVLPLSEFFRKKKNRILFTYILAAAIIGVAVFTLFNLFLYAHQLSQVHDPYYWWLRNVLIGKVTAMAGGFFRIVFPSHLWILPIFLVVLSLILDKKNSKYREKLLFFSILMSLVILTNFSRVYLLGLGFGLFFLKIGLSWRRWLAACLIILIIFVSEFILLWFLVTGNWLGAQILFGRMGTVVQPEEELSSLTRLRILPDLKNQIMHNFWLGRGLGSQVSYLDPLSGQMQKTFNIDWGWLEMLLELGFFGLASYIIFLIAVFYSLIRKIKTSIETEKRFYIGLMAGLASLLFVNITGPFLFHPIGIFYQVLVISSL